MTTTINSVELRPWQYGVKIECNAKGFIQPSIHVYSDKCDCEQLAVILLERTVKELKRSGFKVATSLPELSITENSKKE